MPGKVWERSNENEYGKVLLNCKILYKCKGLIILLVLVMFKPTHLCCTICNLKVRKSIKLASAFSQKSYPDYF